MIGATTSTHGGFLESAQSGSGLASIEHPHGIRDCSHGSDHLGSLCRNPRKMTQEIQCRALGRQDRCHQTADTHDHVAGIHPGSIGSKYLNRNGLIHLPKRLDGTVLAGNHPRLSGHDV